MALSAMSDASQDKPQATTVSLNISARQDGPTNPSEIPVHLLEDVFFAPIKAIIQTTGITRQCNTFDDLSFATLCGLRVLQSSKTGRDFLQTHGIPILPELTRSNYFLSLSSKRRLGFMKDLAGHLRTSHLPDLRAHDDLLASFPELEGWVVWAADGHKIEHATHDPRNQKDQYAPVNGIYILTQWKDNLAPMSAIPREIDRDNPANELITNDETLWFDNTPGQWRRITATCPDSGKTYIILTNQMTLPPGVLSECYRLRWLIEKAFDQQEQKLDERKAWGKSETAKSIQAIAICIAHNLLKIFTANLKRDENIQDSKVIRAYHKDLDKRENEALKAGRPFPKVLYLALYRPTELSLQFIRWMRSCLIRSTPYKQALLLLRPLMDAYI